jgi:hypothetical protein
LSRTKNSQMLRNIGLFHAKARRGKARRVVARGNSGSTRRLVL